MKRFHPVLAVLIPAGLALAIAACTRPIKAPPPAATTGQLTALVTGTCWATLEPCG
jgi:hypothetical protein